MTRKIHSIILVVILVAVAFSGCNTTSSEISSVAESSAPVSSSEDTVSYGYSYGSVDPSSVVVSAVSEESGSKTYTVTDELRGEMFDYFSQYYTLIMPMDDFDEPENLDPDYMLMLGVAVTKPFSIVETTYANNYSYYITDIQASLIKYLGTQLPDGSNVRIYDYDSNIGIVYTSSLKPLYTHFYRITELSKDGDGVYTAKFEVYRNLITSAEEYNSKLSDIRDQIVSGNISDDFTALGSCTLRYVKMTDSEGKMFFRYLSKSSDTITTVQE